MKNVLFCVVLITLSSVLQPCAYAEFETFTNDAGQSLEAELIELNARGDSVSMRLKSGNRIEADLSAFSAKDRKKIKQWWSEVQAAKRLLQSDSRIEVSAKMNRKSKGNAYSAWSTRTDDKTKSFFPEVIIRNDELVTFKDNSIRVVIIAQDLHDPELRLIVSANTLKSDFLDRSDTLLESDPFRLRLYEYDSSYSNYDYAYGYEYEGYVVVIKNSKGEITHTRSSKTKYLSNMDVIMNCKAGEVYDEDINRQLNVSPNSYFVQ